MWYVVGLHILYITDVHTLESTFLYFHFSVVFMDEAGLPEESHESLKVCVFRLTDIQLNSLLCLPSNTVVCMYTRLLCSFPIPSF